VTAEGAEAFVNDLQQQMSAIRQVIKTKDLPKAIGDLQDENRRLLKEIERMGLEQAQAMRGSLRNSVTSVNGIHFISAAITLQDAGIIKTLAFELERELGGNSVIALGAISSDGKPLLSVKVSDDLVKDKKLNAGTMVRELAQKHLKGGGGGQPSYATAGGTDASGMTEALAAVKSYLN
jgi:alanyl-tRNA synthetase